MALTHQHFGKQLSGDFAQVFVMRGREHLQHRIYIGGQSNLYRLETLAHSLDHVSVALKLVVDQIERNRKRSHTVSSGLQTSRSADAVARGGQWIKAAPLTTGATVLKIVDRAIDADLVSHVPIL